MMAPITGDGRYRIMEKQLNPAEPCHQQSDRGRNPCNGFQPDRFRVHAMGNVAVFDTEARMAADKFSYALNQRLPEDIRIQNSCEVPLDFHPRYQKTVKTYEYHILNREFPLPAYRLNAHFTYRPLDIARMQEAARYLEGEHVFRVFVQQAPR